MIDPDIRIIEAVLAGDTEAFGQLVRRHQDRLYDLVYRLVGNGPEAEDIVQTTFIKMFSSLSGFDKKFSFYNWSYTIALNVARNRLRRRRILSFFPFMSVRDGDGGGETLLEPEEPRSSPEDALADSSLKQALENAIAGLPDDIKIPFVLCHLHGRRIKDIADTLGLTPNAVSIRLFRARERLMLELSPKYPEYFKGEIPPAR